MVWGGWAGHEPRQCAEVFAPILEQEGFDVEVSTSGNSGTGHLPDKLSASPTG